ncbi:MAG TPA: CRTAC1 family protein [Pyrinomonadaceae bacterium]|nr:CRTAC1 family protein [Pyrinomonadaceae bacterium]
MTRRRRRDAYLPRVRALMFVLRICLSICLPACLQVSAPRAAAATPAISFADVSASGGLTVRHISTPENRYIVESMSGGAALLDCDADGNLDVAVVNGSSVERFKAGGGDPFVTLYRQVSEPRNDGGPPKFENITTAAGLTRKGWGMAATAVDYDNDGLVDLFLTGFGGNALYRGAGRCKFQDVTEKAGLRGGGFGTGAAWADYDRDGRLDLFVARYVFVDLNNLPEFGSSPATCTYRGIRVQCGPRGLQGETDLLYRNKGDGTFEEVSQKAGVRDERKHYGMGAVWGDYDNDGWLDLFVANDATYNYLYRNNRNGTFTEVAAAQGVGYSESGVEQGSMGVTWGDFDADGRLDLFVSNFENEPNALYKNLGATGFMDVTLASKIGQPSRPYVGWGTAFVDFDNDGWPDLLVANGHVYPQIELTQGKTQTGYRQPFLLFRNLGAGTFEEVSKEAGLRDLAPASRRGAAFGDLNNDGLIDAVVVNLGEAPSVLLNTSENANRRVTLKLVQTGANREAVGARVTLRTARRTLVQEVQAGASYLSQNDLRLHFGIGQDEKIEGVEVRWSGGETETIGGLTPNRMHTITQGKGVTASLDYQTRRKG